MNAFAFLLRSNFFLIQQSLFASDLSDSLYLKAILQLRDDATPVLEVSSSPLLRAGFVLKCEQPQRIDHHNDR
jgi:hypothetical protein